MGQVAGLMDVTLADSVRDTRINGWKAIGQYLGRERTTVMRWAAERGLPVHRVPGGGRASVFAMSSELDAWIEAEAGKSAAADPVEPAAPTSTPPAASPRRKLALAALGAGVLVAGVAAVGSIGQGAEETRGLPKDPAVAALFLQARDDWAQRTPETIDAAIARLRLVTRKDPRFAPAYAGLADAYLLSREFGSMSSAEAFARARQSANLSLRIDPASAPAHRALGFIAYWSDRDIAAAGRHFREALNLAPEDAQTHFWYANALADNGEFAAGRREMAIARKLQPGSPAMRIEAAWADWAEGKSASGEAELRAVARSNPDLALTYDCLRAIRLTAGDRAGFVADTAAMARARNDATLAAQAERLGALLAADPARFDRQVFEDAIAQVEAGDEAELAWPAFVASLNGDRAALVDQLRAASARHEVWGSAGYTRRIAVKWAGDGEVGALLRGLAAPRLE